MGTIYQVYVKGPNGQQISLDMAKTEEQFKSMTVLQLWEKILEKLPDIDSVKIAQIISDLRLIFTDNTLDEDSALLSDYGIQDKSLIFMCIKLPGGGGVLVDPVFPGVGDKDGNNRSMEKLSSF
ncbi:hypothetical protein JOQ06_020077 [Pogonophryne albipinna]|uniref:Ubiquitin-like domain-containing protein n=1 Tax=Pogonophryne albipinna TaxID=1090488 RepID=A0AAD6FWJ8_9TELE|nr:hypothetical protein JOQ06_020077 [Pogonophryne albipinna]